MSSFEFSEKANQANVKKVGWVVDTLSACYDSFHPHQPAFKHYTCKKYIFFAGRKYSKQDTLEYIFCMFFIEKCFEKEDKRFIEKNFAPLQGSWAHGPSQHSSNQLDMKVAKFQLYLE